MQNKITVLIPSYNSEMYIAECIRSIVNQSIKEIKIIILNDGSSDKTLEIIKSYASEDKRIHILNNDRNMGILYSRDKLMSLVETPYFAWMDADDIAHPKRLEKQLEFMSHTEDCGVLGTGWHFISGKRKEVLTKAEDIDAAFLVGNPIHTPTTMVRTDVSKICQYKFSECGVSSASDYPFWTAIRSYKKLMNIEDDLLGYRVHSSQESTSNESAQRYSLNKLIRKKFEIFGVPIDSRIDDFFFTRSNYKVDLDASVLMSKLYIDVIVKNNELGFFDRKSLFYALTTRSKRLFMMHGLEGYMRYIDLFGFKNALHGKKLGLSFFFDCLKARSN